MIEKRFGSNHYEKDRRIISPLDILKVYRQRNIREFLPDNRDESFLDIEGLNMVLQGLTIEPREALSIAFTKVVFAFIETGKIPIVLPIAEKGGGETVQINHN